MICPGVVSVAIGSAGDRLAIGLISDRGAKDFSDGDNYVKQPKISAVIIIGIQFTLFVTLFYINLM